LEAEEKVIELEKKIVILTLDNRLLYEENDRFRKRIKELEIFLDSQKRKL